MAKGSGRSRKSERRKRRLTRRSARAAAASPAHHWDALFGQALRFAASTLGSRTEEDLVGYLARGRLADGRRVLKAFLDTAPLEAEEQTVLRSWTALHGSLYERLEHRGTRLRLRDLVTWEEHTVAVVHPAAAEALEHVAYGAAILLPTPDGPVVGGEVRGVRADASRTDVLAVAANLAAQQPRLCQRAHPDVVAAMLADEHAAFVSFAGNAAIAVAPGELPTVLNSFGAVYSGCTVDGFAAAGLFHTVPNDDATWLVHDPAYGFQLLPELDAFLLEIARRNPVTADAWLRDGRISPAALDLAHRRMPEALDAALTEALREPTAWAEDRDTLIRSHKPRYARPFPHLYPVPTEVADARRAPPIDGVGLNALLGLEG
jgi:hypothetical protein